MNIDLIRDCLDKQVLDRKDRRIGRVDGIVVELDVRGRPRVAGIEIGPATLIRRLPRWLSIVLRVFIQKVSGNAMSRTFIEWNKIAISAATHISNDLTRGHLSAALCI